MTEAVVIDDLAQWRECRDCGLFQCLPEIPDGEAAVCARCDALLRRAAADSVRIARFSAVGAAVLFVLALTLPLVELHVLGRSDQSTIFSGPRVLRGQGLEHVALVVLLTVVVMPAAKLFVELTVLFGVTLAHPPRWLPWLFGWLEHISPWAMVEVFLLGGVVAYTRLQALAAVDVGLAALALGGTMLAMVAVDATLDREAIWEALDAGTPHPGQKRPSAPGSSEATATLIGCTACRRVARAEEGDRCPRCSHRLGARKGPFGRVWALLVAAALLYVPANVLPVMTIERLAQGGPTTIANGVIELARAQLWPLAVIVFLASIVVPVVKLVSLSAMMVMTHRRSASRLAGRTRLFRFVRFIGRWSMIDVFTLSILVGVVRFGAIASVLPGLGAAAFCGVVLLTMAATELFDPRLMWDAAGRQEEAFDRPEVAHAGA
ncbi:MAG TPA: PqiA/YebS family transporter subunit [Polyangiaceae bacterium]|jgi:paraquat-inducible protein A